MPSSDNLDRIRKLKSRTANIFSTSTQSKDVEKLLKQQLAETGESAKDTKTTVERGTRRARTTTEGAEPSGSGESGKTAKTVKKVARTAEKETESDYKTARKTTKRSVKVLTDIEESVIKRKNAHEELLTGIEELTKKELDFSGITAEIIINDIVGKLTKGNSKLIVDNFIKAGPHLAKSNYSTPGFSWKEHNIKIKGKDYSIKELLVSMSEKYEDASSKNVKNAVVQGVIAVMKGAAIKTVKVIEKEAKTIEGEIARVHKLSGRFPTVNYKKSKDKKNKVESIVQALDEMEKAVKYEKVKNILRRLARASATAESDLDAIGNGLNKIDESAKKLRKFAESDEKISNRLVVSATQLKILIEKEGDLVSIKSYIERIKTASAMLFTDFKEEAKILMYMHKIMKAFMEKKLDEIRKIKLIEIDLLCELDGKHNHIVKKMKSNTEILTGIEVSVSKLNTFLAEDNVDGFKSVLTNLSEKADENLDIKSSLVLKFIHEIKSITEHIVDVKDLRSDKKKISVLIIKLNSAIRKERVHEGYADFPDFLDKKTTESEPEKKSTDSEIFKEM
ncbi:hypothetical protein JXA85_05480 [Candidatus Woesearchaeota archaeon]|nr:hypothetical protein [Candidatus Woesearchaeota archaeon]